VLALVMVLVLVGARAMAMEVAIVVMMAIVNLVAAMAADLILDLIAPRTKRGLYHLEAKKNMEALMPQAATPASSAPYRVQTSAVLANTITTECTHWLIDIPTG
jgi:hypothetical protein